MRASFLTRVFDLIAPRVCVVCGKRLSPTESVICHCCHLHLPLTHYEQSPLDNPMARLFWGLFPVERAAALFFYEPQAQLSRLIFDMKYHSMPDVAEDMGTIVARQFYEAGFFDTIDAMVPMPITRRRYWQRGYNQSTKIALGVKEVVGLPVYTDVVKRTRFHQSQTHLHSWQRQENVDGVFRLVHPEKIVGRHILLIDDIVTTGATITACAMELAKAPGVRISILSLGLTKL